MTRRRMGQVLESLGPTKTMELIAAAAAWRRHRRWRRHLQAWHRAASIARSQPPRTAARDYGANRACNVSWSGHVHRLSSWYELGPRLDWAGYFVGKGWRYNEPLPTNKPENHE